MPKFIQWVKGYYADQGLEAHHFYGSSMGKFDCFITVIGSELHAKIHQSGIDGGVKNYIEMRGERILIVEAMVLVQRWIDSSLSFEYQPLVDAVLGDVDGAVDIVKAFSL